MSPAGRWCLLAGVLFAPCAFAQLILPRMPVPAMPAIFTLNGSGTGPAAAIHASNGAIVSSSTPLHGGDYVELYATGLGRTTNRQGLEYADQQPTVTIGGQHCPVTYAGRTPSFAGLDQINCIVPAGLGPNAAAPVIVTSGIRSSNVATLAVE